MKEEMILNLLTSGGPGVAAMAVMFWLVLRELPAQRADRAADARVHAETIKQITQSYREALVEEREAAKADREADRIARHGMKDALHHLNVELVQRIQYQKPKT